jgi:hypothetical protein
MVTMWRFGRIQFAVEPVPIITVATLELARWAADDESLSSWGSTALSLLPPPGRALWARVFVPAWQRGH